MTAPDPSIPPAAAPASDVPLADDVEPLPGWLTIDRSSRRRVHLCWASNWRGALADLLSDEGSTRWDLAFSTNPGDVVLTVLGTAPPLVVFSELVGESETDEDGNDLLVAEDVYPFEDPIVWDEAHVGPAGRQRRSGSLVPTQALQVLEALAREYEAGGDWGFELGACGLDAEVSSAFHVLRLWREALYGEREALGDVPCVGCGNRVDVRDVVVHRTSTARATELPQPWRVLEETELVCESCHRKIHVSAAAHAAAGSPCPSCGATGQALEILFGMPPGPESQEPDVVYWGCIVDRSVPRWSCGACGTTYGRRDAPG
jgi:hypothetical protein